MSDAARKRVSVDPAVETKLRAMDQHNVIVSRCQSFLSDEEPWWEAFCSCGWHVEDTTDQGAWDAFNNHRVEVAREA